MIHAVEATGSTNADMLALAKAGAAEGDWLRAERQTAGRGRQGRGWISPPGNFYASTIVRLRPDDGAATVLAFVAAVAVAEVVHGLLVSSSSRAAAGRDDARLTIKWPNDVLLRGAKVSGILLERIDDAIVIGIGVNLAHCPELADRPATSLAAHGVAVEPNAFLMVLADRVSGWVAKWRREGSAQVLARWLALAHPIGTALTVRLPGGEAMAGSFDGLDAMGALILRLGSGERQVIHAADVFLV